MLRIIIADDNANDRLLFREAFADLGMDTEVAIMNDGVQLMDYLAANTHRLPQLLFLDLNMPHKEGLECLKEIKDNPAYNDISIAIYSATSAKQDVDEAFMCGANVYIQKPADYETLKEVLKRTVISAHNYQSPPLNKANFLLRL